MDTQTLRRLIAKKYKIRNVYLTTEGPKKDRIDLIQNNRNFILQSIKQIRKQEAA